MSSGYYPQRAYPSPRIGARLIPIVIGLGLIAFTMMRGCTPGPFGRSQLVAMDLQQEAALGAQAFQQVLQTADVVRRGAIVDVVKGLAQNLVAASRQSDVVAFTKIPPRDFQWEVQVVRSREANAFCLPGGKIVVYTGILPIAGTDSALAAVMGHEIAHALARHGSERMAQQKLMQMGQMAAAGAMSDMSPTQQRQMMAILGLGAKFGIMLPYSRSHESEADRLGLILMAAAGYEPKYAVIFWQRMKKLSGGGAPPEFASTHPGHERRINDLDAWQEEAWPFYERAPVKHPARPLPSVDGASATLF
jgi:predicted Zn-dependent protease